MWHACRNLPHTTPRNGGKGGCRVRAVSCFVNEKEKNGDSVSTLHSAVISSYRPVFCLFRVCRIEPWLLYYVGWFVFFNSASGYFIAGQSRCGRGRYCECINLACVHLQSRSRPTNFAAMLSYRTFLRLASAEPSSPPLSTSFHFSVSIS